MKISKETLLLLEFKSENIDLIKLNSQSYISNEGYLINNEKQVISNIRFIHLSLISTIKFVNKKNIVFICSKKSSFLFFIFYVMIFLKNPFILYRSKNGLNITKIFFPKYYPLYNRSNLFIIIKRFKIQLLIFLNILKTKYIFF